MEAINQKCIVEIPIADVAAAEDTTHTWSFVLPEGHLYTIEHWAITAGEAHTAAADSQTWTLYDDEDNALASLDNTSDDIDTGIGSKAEVGEQIRADDVERTLYVQAAQNGTGADHTAVRVILWIDRDPPPGPYPA